MGTIYQGNAGCDVGGAAVRPVSIKDTQIGLQGVGILVGLSGGRPIFQKIINNKNKKRIDIPGKGLLKCREFISSLNPQFANTGFNFFYLLMSFSVLLFVNLPVFKF